MTKVRYTLKSEDYPSDGIIRSDVFLSNLEKAVNQTIDNNGGEGLSREMHQKTLENQNYFPIEIDGLDGRDTEGIHAILRYGGNSTMKSDDGKILFSPDESRYGVQPDEISVRDTLAGRYGAKIVVRTDDKSFIVFRKDTSKHITLTEMNEYRVARIDERKRDRLELDWQPAVYESIEEAILENAQSKEKITHMYLSQGAELGVFDGHTHPSIKLRSDYETIDLRVYNPAKLSQATHQLTTL